jgi:hypothetical protein
VPFGNEPPLPEQTDGRRVLELDTAKWSRLLQDRALPLALEGLENARDMTPGSVVVLHRNIDAGARGGAAPLAPGLFSRCRSTCRPTHSHCLYI